MYELALHTFFTQTSLLHNFASLYIWISIKSLEKNTSASLVRNDGSCGRVDHRRVVNGREIPVNQAKLVLREQDRPDCLDLHVRKRFSDATMATCWQEKFFNSH